MLSTQSFAPRTRSLGLTMPSKMAQQSDGAGVMSVFFPSTCLNYESGVLVGWKNSATEDFLLVLSVISLKELEEFETDILERLNDGPRAPCGGIDSFLSFLGVWYSDNDNECNNKLGTVITRLFTSKSKDFIVLRKSETSTPPALYVQGRLKDVDALLVVYADFSGQHVITDHSLASGLAFEGRGTQAGAAIMSNLQQTVLLLNASRSRRHLMHACLEGRKVERQNSIVNLMLHAVKALLSVANSVFARAVRCKIFTFRAVKSVLSLPVVFQQLSWRADQVKSLQGYMNDDSSVGKTSKEGEPSAEGVSSGNSHVPHHSPGTELARLISHRNLSSAALLDVILGILVVACLFSCNCTSTMAAALMSVTDTVACMLSDLIAWLMGIPAGLKLNRQLAYLLGQFFLYHIFLWKTYLAFIQPYIHSIVWFSILPGCFGLTFLLALASDVFSLLTLHIYCFYVYAAKIYSFQVRYLLMLARHFTGRRWNAQTSELEQVPYKIDQLFIGTVLFTILLFLVPTTGLFYCVFTMLRTLVLLSKGLINCIIRCINHVPVYTLYKALFKPGALAGSLQFELVQPPVKHDTLCLGALQLHCCSGVLHLRMTSRPLCLNQLFIWPERTSEDRNTNEEQSWGQLAKKILLGQLIYPWINKKRTA